jgi:hypothetical protein
VELGDHIETVSLPLPAAPVSLDSGEWEFISTGIQLDIAGFDNTRSTTEVAFTFFDTNGRALTTEPLRVKVGNAFREYFLHSELGGLFSLRAAFPVAGDVNRVGAAEVQFVNLTGPSQVQRIKIR